MPQISQPGHADIHRWLEAMQMEFYLCGACDGFHLTKMQELPGVFDSKLELIEEQGLLQFSTSMELRPATLFKLHSELGELNNRHNELKIFIELMDDTLPKLVITTHVRTAAGLSEAQFADFVGYHSEVKIQLLRWLHDQGYALPDEVEEEQPSAPEIELSQQTLLH
ncbi:YbjN domain-containing protein [Ferrimonas sediminicola]|uniref:YbjN domain-containing protein n=1 Tax=Ferrimonas sediminicola TaxID=2569538 RepID=A0A4U1BEY8_9GAMM|nr:YbjN domain-containing protein [Ferrimonas sediminicola]TKB48910.1 YbjN domain-containing protein [Ferrimonas sediminicola]